MLLRVVLAARPALRAAAANQQAVVAANQLAVVRMSTAPHVDQPSYLSSLDQLEPHVDARVLCMIRRAVKDMVEIQLSALKDKVAGKNEVIAVSKQRLADMEKALADRLADKEKALADRLADKEKALAGMEKALSLIHN